MQTQVARVPGKSADVVLVSMPFGPLCTPSLGLGLLAAHLRAAGIANRTLYLTIPFAKRIGSALYGAVSDGEPGTHLLLGDWLFRDALFGAPPAGDDDAYLALLNADVIHRSSTERRGPWASRDALLADVAAIRSEIDGFLSACASEILALEPAIVGFTTVFQQNVASLALARRIKQRSPRTRILFGGANCEGAMGIELLERFDFTDYVVSGEGDRVIVPLVEAILAGRPVALDGVYARGAAVASGATSAVWDLDALPYPEYEPYFEQLRAQAPELEPSTRILYETSRGCWWGERSHCTFCGLNGTTMRFRSKSADRAYRELEWLTASYPERPVSVVDNILDLRYFDDFVPMLRDAPVKAELFYEVKANLRKAQLRKLYDANIRMIQPGIESLSDSVLRLMRKGVSALQNVQLLKWCREIGITPQWNLIWGFPGEDPAAYAEMTRLIPLIRHLPAPGAFSPIRLDRFSPNFDEAEQRGLRNVRPFPAYDYVYSGLTPGARHDLAYYFEFDHADGRDVTAYTRGLRDELAAWCAAGETLAYFWIPSGDRLVLCDLRDASRCELTLLEPLESRLYRICDAGRTAEEAHRALDDPGVTLEQVERSLAKLSAQRAMVSLSSRYLSLAVDFIESIPPAAALQRFADDVALRDATDSQDPCSLALADITCERTTEPLITR